MLSEGKFQESRTVFILCYASRDNESESLWFEIQASARMREEDSGNPEK